MRIITHILALALSTQIVAAESVVLLHGLARSSKSMAVMSEALTEEGYDVVNLSYPSQSATIEELAQDLRARIEQCTQNKRTVHFVTHSMGGILVRQIQKTAPLPNIGRVVMLSPPNQGSEVTDKLKDTKPYQWLNGPAGQQLGTHKDGFVQALGPVDFDLAVITGDRSINWILSTMIPGKDDGKVSLESAKVEGMQDYHVIHATHPFIMKNKEAIAMTVSFLQTGQIEQP